jgi:hypothetical protein
MNDFTINTDGFDLPFLIELVEGESEELEENRDLDYELEKIQEQIPSNVIYLGFTEEEIFNGWNQQLRDEYYIIPLKDQDYKWGLFRIYWDDNWEKWKISGDARLKSQSINYKEAAKILLTHLWNLWEKDFSKEGRSSYYHLLSSLNQ